ncbi:MAG: hypothetical protein V1722_02625 [Candidatus Micrarchaeota archaeon]
MSWFRPTIVHELRALSTKKRENGLGDWKWFSRSAEYDLKDITAADVVVVSELDRFHHDNLTDPVKSTFVFMKARQLYDYIRLQHYGSPLFASHVSQRKNVNEILDKLQEIFQREVNHPQLLQRIVVSAPHAPRFLHRTNVETARKIIRVGLHNSLSLQSTATWQPRDVAQALANYHKKHKGSDAVVVLEIPREIWEEAHSRDGGDGEVLHPLFGTDKQGGTVNPVHVLGFFDQKHNHNFTLNARYAKFRV